MRQSDMLRWRAAISQATQSLWSQARGRLSEKQDPVVEGIDALVVEPLEEMGLQPTSLQRLGLDMI